MKKISTIALFCIASALLAGCGVSTKNYGFENRDKSYLKASSIPPTRIPSGLASNGFKSYYPVSQKHYSLKAKEVSIIPPGLKGAA